MNSFYHTMLNMKWVSVVLQTCDVVTQIVWHKEMDWKWECPHFVRIGHWKLNYWTLKDNWWKAWIPKHDFITLHQYSSPFSWVCSVPICIWKSSIAWAVVFPKHQFIAILLKQPNCIYTIDFMFHASIQIDELCTEAQQNGSLGIGLELLFLFCYIVIGNLSLANVFLHFLVSLSPSNTKNLCRAGDHLFVLTGISSDSILACSRSTNLRWDCQRTYTLHEVRTMHCG